MRGMEQRMRAMEQKYLLCGSLFYYNSKLKKEVQLNEKRRNHHTDCCIIIAVA